MTKARARERARAKAGQKAKKRRANADRTDQTIRPGQFDPSATHIKRSGANTGSKVFGAARRGAARSK
ncbi:hypothetical protein OAJ57_01155 [Alphaproteobacteria bacterium]|nr:hypothetical protein [Alphaproteobacteria bacterium]